MRYGDTSLGPGPRNFPNTTWGLVSRLRDSGAGDYRSGLEALCRRYWKPVYYYVRIGWAKSNDAAKDLTQEFFLWLMEGDPLKRYSPERGGFRAYLKVLLRRFVGHEETAARRLKRGGAVKTVELDGEAAPLEEIVAEAESAEPEAVFDAAWISEVMGHALQRVQTALEADGKGRLFQAFEAYELRPPEERPTYAELAGRMGVKESDITNYLFTVRRQVRDEIRAELARLTVDDPGLEEEWNALFGA